jgi:TRAP-type C4-dicarboxylate transport system permease small subunit
VNLKKYGPEGWVTLVFFWVLAIVVFLQFFTRYALNNPLAWTEEIARYLLTCVAFLGGGIAVRRYSHIHVEFLYIYYPKGLAHFLSILVDIIRIVFFGYATWLCWKVTLIMKTQPMVVVDWPMSIIYGMCTFGIAMMTFRAIQVAILNWSSGSSVLTRVGQEGRHQ